MYSNQVVSELGHRGYHFDAVNWTAENCDSYVNFIHTILTYRDFSNKIVLSENYFNKNHAIFALCEYRESFKKRFTGEIVDEVDNEWFNKKKFKKFAHECYYILERQNDLEDWQIKLKLAFKEMI